MRSVARGGRHNRLAEPDWHDPLETSYARDAGGRWNPPGAFGLLYLNASGRMARLQVEHKLAGQPFGIEDLDPLEQHDLVEVDVDSVNALDAITADGLAENGLPVTYPRDAAGGVVAHAVCQDIGVGAYAEQTLEAIACRSAAGGATVDDHELAVFDRVVRDRVAIARRRAFAEWYLDDSGLG